MKGDKIYIEDDSMIVDIFFKSIMPIQHIDMKITITGDSTIFNE